MIFDLHSLVSQAREASKKLALISTDSKNKALLKIAKALRDNSKKILEANEIDIALGEKNGLGPMIDRLMLNNERIENMAREVENVASLKDYVSEIIEDKTREDGLRLQKIRVPFGVIAMIYESRPNVTSDASVLCIKSGNSVILKGGSDAINSNRAIVKIIKEALSQTEIPSEAVQFIDTVEHSVVTELLKMKEDIDVVIPRGGKGLINFVSENSRIPVINTGASVVHTYIDKDADIDKACKIVVNAKTRRVSICNALDTLLVHKDIEKTLMQKLLPMLKEKNVEVRYPARDEDLGVEFLDYILAVKVVSSLNEAIEHITKYSLKHSEAIVTENRETAEEFLKRVDSACCFWNASTQFSDGAQFGLGAEIGISTQKLHVRGPFALEGLTSYKWVIRGDGHIRQP